MDSDESNNKYNPVWIMDNACKTKKKHEKVYSENDINSITKRKVSQKSNLQKQYVPSNKGIDMMNSNEDIILSNTQFDSDKPNIVLKRKGCEIRQIPFNEKHLELSIKQDLCPLVLRIHRGFNRTVNDINTENTAKECPTSDEEKHSQYRTAGISQESDQSKNIKAQYKERKPSLSVKNKICNLKDQQSSGIGIIQNKSFKLNSTSQFFNNGNNNSAGTLTKDSFSHNNGSYFNSCSSSRDPQNISKHNRKYKKLCKGKNYEEQKLCSIKTISSCYLLNKNDPFKSSLLHDKTINIKHSLSISKESNKNVHNIESFTSSSSNLNECKSELTNKYSQRRQNETFKDEYSKRCYKYKSRIRYKKSSKMKSKKISQQDFKLSSNVVVLNASQSQFSKISEFLNSNKLDKEIFFIEKKIEIEKKKSYESSLNNSTYKILNKPKQTSKIPSFTKNHEILQHTNTYLWNNDINHVQKTLSIDNLVTSAHLGNKIESLDRDLCHCNSKELSHTFPIDEKSDDKIRSSRGVHSCDCKITQQVNKCQNVLNDKNNSLHKMCLKHQRPNNNEHRKRIYINDDCIHDCKEEITNAKTDQNKGEKPNMKIGEHEPGEMKSYVINNKNISGIEQTKHEPNLTKKCSSFQIKIQDIDSVLNSNDILSKFNTDDKGFSQLLQSHHNCKTNNQYNNENKAINDKYSLVNYFKKNIPDAISPTVHSRHLVNMTEHESISDNETGKGKISLINKKYSNKMKNPNNLEYGSFLGNQNNTLNNTHKISSVRNRTIDPNIKGNHHSEIIYNTHKSIPVCVPPKYTSQNISSDDFDMHVIKPEIKEINWHKSVGLQIDPQHRFPRVNNMLSLDNLDDLQDLFKSKMLYDNRAETNHNRTSRLQNESASSIVNNLKQHDLHNIANPKIIDYKPIFDDKKYNINESSASNKQSSLSKHIDENLLTNIRREFGGGRTKSASNETDLNLNMTAPNNAFNCKTSEENSSINHTAGLKRALPLSVTEKKQCFITGKPINVNMFHEEKSFDGLNSTNFMPIRRKQNQLPLKTLIPTPNADSISNCYGLEQQICSSLSLIKFDHLNQYANNVNDGIKYSLHSMNTYKLNSESIKPSVSKNHENNSDNSSYIMSYSGTINSKKPSSLIKEFEVIKKTESLKCLPTTVKDGNFKYLENNSNNCLFIDSQQGTMNILRHKSSERFKQNVDTTVHDKVHNMTKSNRPDFTINQFKSNTSLNILNNPRNYFSNNKSLLNLNMSTKSISPFNQQISIDSLSGFKQNKIEKDIDNEANSINSDHNGEITLDLQKSFNSNNTNMNEQNIIKEISRINTLNDIDNSISKHDSGQNNQQHYSKALLSKPSSLEELDHKLKRNYSVNKDKFNVISFPRILFNISVKEKKQENKSMDVKKNLYIPPFRTSLLLLPTEKNAKIHHVSHGTLSLRLNENTTRSDDEFTKIRNVADANTQTVEEPLVVTEASISNFIRKSLITHSIDESFKNKAENKLINTALLKNTFNGQNQNDTKQSENINKSKTERPKHKSKTRNAQRTKTKIKNKTKQINSDFLCSYFSYSTFQNLVHFLKSRNNKKRNASGMENNDTLAIQYFGQLHIYSRTCTNLEKLLGNIGE